MVLQFDHLKVHVDIRGLVFEPLDPERIGIQKNVHIVINSPGAVRGNHYHLKGIETVAIKGRALVCIRENREIRNMKCQRIAFTALLYRQKYPMLLKT